MEGRAEEGTKRNAEGRPAPKQTLVCLPANRSALQGPSPPPFLSPWALTLHLPSELDTTKLPNCPTQLLGLTPHHSGGHIGQEADPEGQSRRSGREVCA